MFVSKVGSTDSLFDDLVFDDRFSTDEDFPIILVKNLFFGVFTLGLISAMGRCNSGIFFFPTSRCFILADLVSGGSS